MLRLNKVTLRGFKSIRDAEIELRALNVLIGPNGAGKSSLIAFFRLMSELVQGRLQHFIAMHGRAHSLLHHGPQRTPQMDATLEWGHEETINRYSIRLSHGVGDTLFFAQELLEFAQAKVSGAFSPGTGHLESHLGDKAAQNDPATREFRQLLESCRVFHFHDTSPTARVRQAGYVRDHKSLLYDAGNLAAFLYRLKCGEDSSVYRRIVGTIRLIAPFFDDFDLEPTGPRDSEIFLNWREKDSDQLFGSHQLSDGTLRAICLVTLLLQPVEDLPDVIIVDEPELGLHPYALTVIAELLQRAAAHSQILISTQSSTLLDRFEPEDVIVVDRTSDGSTFSRPDRAKLSAWLDEYSLGEVWEKNVLAGGPH